MQRQHGFATRQIHTGKPELPGIRPLATPIFQSSTFIFDNAAQGAARFAGEEEGYIYSRLGNPNANQVGAIVAGLENGEAGLALSSGMGAIATVMWTLLRAGDHVLADETLYGCTFAQFTHGLTRYGIEVTLTDFSNKENITSNLRKNTKVVYFETPCNPNMKILDIEMIADIAHKHNKDIHVVVDNTFCTPYIQRPLDWGTDVVVHSGTKYLNGHGDVVCGMIVGKKAFVQECASYGIKDMTGATISPFDAFLVTRGLKTLDIRMEKHTKNATALAQYLQGHEKVQHVYYPGLPTCQGYATGQKQMKLPGGMITFELRADKAASEAFINSLALCTLAVSLGDAETLIQHPASMTHSAYSAAELKQAGISESMIRLSVGLENVEDIQADLAAALERL